MRWLQLCAPILGLWLIFGGCAKEKVGPVYKGDGKLIDLAVPGMFGHSGWRIDFDVFSLSKDFSATYVFTGLPEIQKPRPYYPFLYIPPTLQRLAFDSAVLQMELYANCDLIAKCDKPINKWDCWTTSSTAKVATLGDGLEKRFYDRDLSIAANRDIEYRLHVHYTPPKSGAVDGLGHFFLQIGGLK